MTTISADDLTGLAADITTIDTVVESNDGTTTTKNGKSIKTLAGQLATLAREPAVAYAGAITISRGTQTVIEGGVPYAPIPSELPFTTSGTWGGDDEDRFYAIALTDDGVAAANDRSLEQKSYQYSSSAAGASHPGIAAGFVIKGNMFDGNNIAGSGAEHAYTGTTAAGKAGNWPDADGYFYDADGKQFSVVGVANILAFGAVNDGATDNVAALGAATSGPSVEIEVPYGEFLIQSAFTIATSDISIFGRGWLVFDWEDIGAVNVITFSGDRVRTSIRAKALDSAYVIANKATLAEKHCLYFTGEDCSAIEGESQNNPGYVGCFGSNVSFTAIRNHGYSVITGDVQDSTDYTLIHINDGEGCLVVNNYGRNFGHGVLAGGSTNNTLFDGNRFKDCGNHCLYVSSGDDNTVVNNKAEGLYTDIKVRGDNNVVSINSVKGGSLSATNRLADTGNGFGLNSLKVDGNDILCLRPSDIGLNLAFRTGFDCNARGVSATSNVVRMAGSVSTYGMQLMFLTMQGVTVENNTVISDVGITDGFQLRPTDGFTTASWSRGTVSGNSATGIITGQSYQIVGEYLALSTNTGESQGGTGSGSGGMMLFLDKSTVSNNPISVTNENVFAINNRGGDHNVYTANVLEANGANYLNTTGANDVAANNIEV